MAPEARRIVTRSGEVAALAHPLRLDLLNHLMSKGPATASQCARAVGDTASNCSYHLRYLAKHGLVEPVGAGQDPKDQRERPWRATITGFGVDPTQLDPREQTALATIALQRTQRLASDYLARRDTVSAEWQAAAEMATYTLRMSPAELTDLIVRLDALIRPYIAATREDGGGSLVHMDLHAFVLDAER
jgi:DNA-binding transcriptional ArsR family regulator